MKKLFTTNFIGKLLAFTLITAILAGCQTTDSASAQESTQATTDTTVAAATETTSVATAAPKYIFLFIGDGMSYPQVQSASYYLGTTQSDGEVTSSALSFTDFPVTGSAMTYDSTSFAPDSASTATSLSTGYKTYSGTINMDTSFTTSYETITEKLKTQKDYKIGVVSSVNINHATPAAFYAHQESRNNYYEIGLELIESDFDYFAGGQFIQPTGADDNQTNITELAEQAGYKVLTTYADSEKLTAADGKAILLAEKTDSSDAMNYSLDADESEWSLSDYVSKGIEVLQNDTGFFMMVEGGKIDWAGHANDAGANINDTIAFSEAVRPAIEFYNEHPTETLILVTGDHETGGMSIGFAGTNYSTYLTNLAGQTITYENFDSGYVADYKAKNTPFEDVLKDIESLFGLITSDHPDAADDNTLVLTDYEYGLLENAYQRTLTVGKSEQSEMAQEEYVQYGTYEPLTVTITHLLNNKSGLAFTSYSHTGLPVPVFAQGVGAELFEGYYDNTDIYYNMAEVTGVK